MEFFPFDDLPGRGVQCLSRLYALPHGHCQVFVQRVGWTNHVHDQRGCRARRGERRRHARVGAPYGVVTPERTAAGYRLYDVATINRIRAMRQLWWRKAGRRAPPPHVCVTPPRSSCGGSAAAAPANAGRRSRSPRRSLRARRRGTRCRVPHRGARRNGEPGVLRADGRAPSLPRPARPWSGLGIRSGLGGRRARRQRGGGALVGHGIRGGGGRPARCPSDPRRASARSPARARRPRIRHGMPPGRPRCAVPRGGPPGCRMGSGGPRYRRRAAVIGVPTAADADAARTVARALRRASPGLLVAFGGQGRRRHSRRDRPPRRAHRRHSRHSIKRGDVAARSRYASGEHHHVGRLGTPSEVEAPAFPHIRALHAP